MKSKVTIDNETEELAMIHPLIVPAYHKLGVDKVKKLRYVKKKIEDELTKIDQTKELNAKLETIIKRSISYPCTLTCPDLIRIISNTYHTLGITEKAKASHIERWFSCKKKSKKINGKTTTVYEIYCPKLMS